MKLYLEDKYLEAYEEGKYKEKLKNDYEDFIKTMNWYKQMEEPSFNYWKEKFSHLGIDFNFVDLEINSGDQITFSKLDNTIREKTNINDSIFIKKINLKKKNNKSVYRDTINWGLEVNWEVLECNEEDLKESKIRIKEIRIVS